MRKRLVFVSALAVMAWIGLPQGSRDAVAKDSSTAEKLPVVQKVTFLGAKHIKEEELRTITGIKPGMPLNPKDNEAGCRKILAKYEEMGRACSYCQLLKGGDPGDTEVIYQITEGPKVTVRDILFTGNTFVRCTRLMKKCAATPIGGTYKKQMAETEIDELVKLYRSFGYRNVKVSLEPQWSDDGAEVILIFHIQEGTRSRVKVEKTEEQRTMRVGQIFLRGNERTSDESILAHVPLFPGQVLSYPELRQAEKKLAKLGLFVVDPANGIRPTITVVDADGDSVYKDVLITVKEKPQAKQSK